MLVSSRLVAARGGRGRARELAVGRVPEGVGRDRARVEARVATFVAGAVRVERRLDLCPRNPFNFAST